MQTRMNYRSAETMISFQVHIDFTIGHVRSLVHQSWYNVDVGSDMDAELLPSTAAVIGDLGHHGAGFRQILLYHPEEERFKPEEVSVRSGLFATVRGDQCFVSLHILACP